MSVRRISSVIGPLFIQPELEYIASEANLADPISPLHVLTLGRPGVSIGDPCSPNARILISAPTPIPHLDPPSNPLHPLRTLVSLPTSMITLQGLLPHNGTVMQIPPLALCPAPCKSQKGRSIQNNQFRPNVRAADQLNAWSSPYAIRQRELLSKQLPNHIINDAFNIAEEGLSGPTKVNYAAGLLCFNQFCNKENIPEDDRMPASEILLAGFVGAFAGTVSGRTI
ncbi:hypothetical protein F5050DRAFT_1813886, partial [Lentinula boryana]